MSDHRRPISALAIHSFYLENKAFIADCFALLMTLPPRQGWLSARKAKQGTAMGDDSVVTDVWKFNKKTQAWLLRHMFIENEVCGRLS